MSATGDEAVRVILFDLKVFDIEAVKRAAYRFSDRVSVEITSGANQIQCKIYPLKHNSMLDMEALTGAFRNEVLDQDLRQKIAAETEPYRNLILSLAFSKTPLGK